MSRRRRIRAFLAAAATLFTLLLPGASSGQGRSQYALERVQEIQERHTEALLARAGVIGTAVGVGERGENAVLVFLERPDIGGLPQELDGAPVETVVTGTIYALAEPVDLQWWWWPSREPHSPGGADRPRRQRFQLFAWSRMRFLTFWLGRFSEP